MSGQLGHVGCPCLIVKIGCSVDGAAFGLQRHIGEVLQHLGNCVLWDQMSQFLVLMSSDETLIHELGINQTELFLDRQPALSDKP